MEAKPADGPYLSGKVLLAMPGMGDPRFHRAVIFICAHDAKGAMGLAISQAVPGLDFGALMKQMNVALPENAAARHMPILNGGPVENARGFIMHSNDFLQADTVRVTDELSVTGTVDALRAVAEGRGPQRLLFVLGYAGWGAGQLDREIQDNAWMVADVSADLIFNTQPGEKWDRVMQTIGVDPSMLSGDAGHA